MNREYFRVLEVNVGTGKSRLYRIDGRGEAVRVSGLAALLFEQFGRVDKP